MTEIPEGADTIFFTPSNIVVEGGLPDLEEAVGAVVAPLAGMKIPVSKLFEAVAAIERAYAEAGYPFARAVVPPQRLSEGATARLLVVDGFIEDVRADGIPERLREAVLAIMRPLVGRSWVRLEEVERALMIAGDLPGGRVRSAITPGKAEGGVLLVLEGESDVAGGSLSIDNTASKAFDGRNTSLQLSLNSYLGFGEQIYAFSSFDPIRRVQAFGNQAPKRSFGGGVTIPLGVHGTRLGVEATRSITRPRGGFFETKAVFDRWSVNVAHPFIRSRVMRLGGTVKIEVGNEKNSAPEFGVMLSHDPFKMLRIGADFSTRLEGMSVSASATVTAARGNEPSEAPYSRGAATQRFRKAEATVVVGGQLPAGIVAQATIRGQGVIAGGLPTSELFALDTQDAISSLMGRGVSGDQGATARLQVSRPLEPFPDHLALSPYLFGAFGRAFYTAPTEFDTNRVRNLGVGLSVDLFGPDTTQSLNIVSEYGVVSSDGPTPRDHRLTVSVRYGF